MYIFPEFLEAALRNGNMTWASEKHKTLAEKILLCNPRYVSMDALVDGVRIVNSISFDKLETITVKEVIDLGLYL